MPTAFCYVRADTRAARDAQAEALRGYFDAKLATAGFAWGKVFTDGQANASRPFGNRPGGFDCNLALEAGDVLLVPSLAVAFSTVADFLGTVDTWRARGVELAVADLGIDSRTPEGRERLKLLAGVAELQQASRVDRGRLGVARRKAAGKNTGGRAPIGFRYVGPFGRRRLVPDKDEQDLVRRMLAWRRSGCTLHEIYFHLLRHGARHRGREWSVTRISRALEAGEKWPENCVAVPEPNVAVPS